MASELEDVVVVVAPDDHDHEPDEPRTPLLGGQQVDLAIDDNDVEEPAQNPSHDTTPSKRPPSTERGSSSNSESPASSLEWLKNRLQAVCTSRDDTITMTEWKLAVNYPVSPYTAYTCEKCSLNIIYCSMQCQTSLSDIMCFRFPKKWQAGQLVIIVPA